MNLKYSVLGLISGYLGAYFLDYLKNNNQSVNFSPNPFTSEKKEDESETGTSYAQQ